MPSILYSYSSGGANINLSLACGYFRRATVPPSEGGTQCSPPPKGEIVRPITSPAGINLQAATTADAPGDAAVECDPSHGRDESVGVVLADDGGVFQAASCTLAPGQRQLCLAGLGLFADQSLAAQAGAPALAASTTRSAACPLGTPPERVSCRSRRRGGGRKVEREINKKKDSPIPIPDESIKTPPAVQAVVTASFVPEEVTVCDTGLTPMLRTPDGFDGGLLSLNAKIADQSIRGPFTYSADATAWTSVPGAPSGQPLKTQSNPLSIEAVVDPHLSIVYKAGGSDSGAEPVLEIAHVTMSAVWRDVTLVGPSGPLLRVSLGPSLELSVGIKKKDAEEKVKDAESQGEDETTAEADVADQIAANAVHRHRRGGLGVRRPGYLR